MPRILIVNGRGPKDTGSQESTQERNSWVLVVAKATRGKPQVTINALSQAEQAMDFLEKEPENISLIVTSGGPMQPGVGGSYLVRLAKNKIESQQFPRIPVILIRDSATDAEAVKLADRVLTSPVDANELSEAICAFS